MRAHRLIPKLPKPPHPYLFRQRLAVHQVLGHPVSEEGHVHHTAGAQAVEVVYGLGGDGAQERTVIGHYLEVITHEPHKYLRCNNSIEYKENSASNASQIPQSSPIPTNTITIFRGCRHAVLWLLRTTNRTSSPH